MGDEVVFLSGDEEDENFVDLVSESEEEEGELRLGPSVNSLGIYFNYGTKRIVYGCRVTSNKCDGCKRTFDDVFALRAHVQNSVVCGTFKACFYCEKKNFPSIYSLQSHVKSAHLTCKICGKICRLADGLKYHLKRAHPDRHPPSACPHCSLVLDEESALQSHIDAVHTPRTCSECRSEFSLKSEYENHFIKSKCKTFELLRKEIITITLNDD